MLNLKRDDIYYQCIAEFCGTGLLVFFGVGCVAAVILANANLDFWGISITWGLGVSVAIYCSKGVSGGHLNPAVTIALAAFHGFDKYTQTTSRCVIQSDFSAFNSRKISEGMAVPFQRYLTQKWTH